ncbi:hypothetical protein AGOR_G00193070 [Albula goreensis]|uniref:Uncharacterized protein n=1 Tax=Albula goreensis TaxID=1534307 RepID=A0A8T3CTM2_9TELE|nr:hypothetical protein AGOR_G00193070 [Albula goreensis]
MGAYVGLEGVDRSSGVQPGGCWQYCGQTANNIKLHLRTFKTPASITHLPSRPPPPPLLYCYTLEILLLLL